MKMKDNISEAELISKYESLNEFIKKIEEVIEIEYRITIEEENKVLFFKLSKYKTKSTKKFENIDDIRIYLEKIYNVEKDKKCLRGSLNKNICKKCIEKLAMKAINGDEEIEATYLCRSIDDVSEIENPEFEWIYCYYERETINIKNPLLTKLNKCPYKLEHIMTSED
jgi:hypothetical protein